MAIHFSNIPPKILQQKLDTIFLSFAEAERLAVETGQEKNVVKLCQFGMILTSNIKNTLHDDTGFSDEKIKQLMTCLQELQS